MPDIFISYSRRDKDFVTRLNQALSARGKDAWVDWEDIPASAEWLREIQDGIDATDAFLFVLSPDSVNSEVCARELDHAVDRRKRILPILHRDVDPKSVRPEAAAVNWVFLRDQDPFDEGLETLLRAIDTDLDHVKAHTRLSNQAIDWERDGHDRALLLRGSELEGAERWLTEAASKQPPATELQARFVQASRDAARRRGRFVLGAVALALVVAITLAIVALIQRADAVQQSHIAFARALDAQAQNQYDTDPELSVLLAVQASRTSPSTATEEALRSALGRSHVRERYTNPTGSAIADALWSPDGSRLLLAEDGANQALIVRPGAGTKPLVLPAPGMDSQIAWDGTGRLAITGGSQLNVWDGRTGALVRRLPAHGLQVAVSRSGDRVASADLGTGDVRVFNVANGRLVALGAPGKPGTASCLHLSPDGSIVAECMLYGSRSEVLLYDARTGHALHTFTERGDVLGVAFSPDSRRIAVASIVLGSNLHAPGTFVYDVGSGAQVLAFKGSSTAVDFSRDGRYLAYSQTVGNIAWVYSLADRSEVPLQGNTGSIRSIHFSPDGAYVITSSNDGTARVFEYLGGAQVEVLAGHTEPVTDATMTADDTQIASASEDGTARVWTTPVPRPIAETSGPAGAPRGMGFSADGRRVAVIGPTEIKIFDARSLATIAAPRPPAGQLYSGGGWSLDGRWVVALTGPPGSKGLVQPGQIQVYDGRTGALTGTIAARSPIFNAQLNGRGELATVSLDGEVDLWALSTPRRLSTLLAPGSKIENLTFSKDGSRVALTRADGTIDVIGSSGVHLLTLRGMAPSPELPGVPSSSPQVVATFSPDGSRIVSAAGNELELWDASSGRLVRTMTKGLTPFVSLAFSPDSRTLAAGDAASVHLWQVPSGTYIRELQHANSSVYGLVANPLEGVRLAFGPDGQTLATAGDFAVRVWKLPSGESLFDAFGPLGDMSFQSRRVVVFAAGAVKLYSCDLCGDLQQLLATAARTTTRSLTPGERALYLRQS